MAERANIAGPTGQHRFLCIQRCVYVLSNKNLSIGILSNSALSAQLAYFDNLQLSRDISNIFCLIGHYESKRCTLWINKNDTSRIFQSLVPYRGLSGLCFTREYLLSNRATSTITIRFVQFGCTEKLCCRNQWFCTWKLLESYISYTLCHTITIDRANFAFCILKIAVRKKKLLWNYKN